MLTCKFFETHCVYGFLNFMCNFIIQICNVMSMCLSVYSLPSSNLEWHSKMVCFTIALGTVMMTLKQTLNLELKMRISPKNNINSIDI